MAIEILAWTNSDGSTVIGMRDSKNPDVPAQIYDKQEFADFLQGIKDGVFDDLLVNIKKTDG